MVNDDIIILGGNVAGCTAAILLAEQGYDITIYEEKIWDKPCGGALSNEYVRWFESKDVFFDDRYQIKRVLVMVNYRVYEKTIDKPHLWESGLSRLEIQEKLIKRVKELGVGVKTEKVTLERADELAQNSALTIVATGHNRLAWTLLGRQNKPQDTSVCRVAEFPTDEQLDFFLYAHDTYSAASGYGWVFTKQGRVNIGLLSFERKYPIHKRFDRFIDVLERKLKIEFRPNIPKGRIFGGKLPTDVNALQKPMFNERNGNLYIGTGDAIGIVNPASGAGIAYSVKSAEELVKCFNSDGTFAPIKFQRNMQLKFADEWKAAQRHRRYMALAMRNGLTRSISSIGLRLFGDVLINKIWGASPWDK
ncbi:MAG: NAD(P)/FAD-dependent oxidoreductase [Candidatus Hermodarchaeota archaeon]